MRRWLWLLIFLPALALGEEQPPFDTKNAAADENFKILFFQAATHNHRGADSKRMDWLSLVEISTPTASNTDSGEAGVYFRNGFMVLFYNSAGSLSYSKLQVGATTWTTGAP
jgi:hypothetical protein